MRRLFLLAPLILSMSEPVKNPKLKVELEDRSGIKHSLKGLVCNGKPFLKVREGNVEYSVDFSSLRGVEILGQDGNQIRVRLLFRDRSSKEYFLPLNTYCRANSQAGEAGFYLKEVKNIFISMEER
ncbi:MAG: hypothetical protein RMK75_03205 [Aquificaceae bacterium]|nr:hypothetical protein [Aquificaceae bacterium]MCS7277869.1 hypothetical protein [Aquificaceae bacterium]MDW8423314.1 hypothetical protein [Aquificaceae bacterium]